MQQINLYLPELRPQRDWLSSRNAAWATLAFLVFVVIVQVIWHLRAHNLNEQIVERQQVVDEMQVRVNQLMPKAVVVNQSLDNVVTQLELAIANRQKVRRIISGQNMGNSRGFRGSMLTLARQSHTDIALDHFTFSRGGNYVQMHGSARNAEAVPLFLQRLKPEPAFSSARFGLLSVSSESTAADLLEFSLGYDNVYQQAPGGKSK